MEAVQPAAVPVNAEVSGASTATETPVSTGAETVTAESDANKTTTPQTAGVELVEHVEHVDNVVINPAPDGADGVIGAPVCGKETCTESPKKAEVVKPTASTGMIKSKYFDSHIIYSFKPTECVTSVPIESEKLPESPQIASDGAEPMNTDAQAEIAAEQTKQADEAEAPIEMDCETSETATIAVAEAAATGDATVAAAPASAVQSEAGTGLSLLAGYGSDEEDTNKANDDDDVVEVPVTDTIPNTATSAPRRVVTLSSGSDSSCTYSDSDSEGEYLTVLRQKIDKRINTEDCDDDDDDCDGDDARPRRRQPPKVRGEMLLDDLPPIEQLEITVPEDECIELGKVQSIVDQLVLVSVLPNSMLFDLDTVLFLEKGRKVLGQVFDVLGQVADPLYCVRFNSNEQIKERGINIGDIVYCAPQTEHTQFVILSKLMQVRGSDASWEHDVEPPARFVDYSDDEAEREARFELRKKRQRERTNSTDSVETVSTVTTETSEAPSSSTAASRQRGRRAQRESRQPNRNHNGNPQQYQQHQQPQHQSRSQSRDSEYNYHPSYNPGSWHSNYYHNYHPPAANFNMMPGMGFPVPTHGYGYPPPPNPYAMPPPPMHMGMPPPLPPSHMYPQPYNQQPPQQHPPPHYGPPRSGN